MSYGRLSGGMLLLAVFICGGALTAVAAGHSQGEALFARKVRPLLAEKCLACHGEEGKRIKGGLNLTTRELMLKGGEYSDQVLVPGKANESLLYTATTWQDPDLEMPPKENDRLTEQQTWYLRDWINAGAPWPDDETVAAILAEPETPDEGMVAVETSGGLSGDWTRRFYQEEDLWAYQPLRKPSVPGSGKAHPVDAFLARKLKETGLEPAPPADRRTLIRRASFDLLGLPPSPEEVEAFVNDPGPDAKAFAKVIDRFLASPHYGERWGRHWLDVVRYADSSGFANDYERGNTWRYRDYVIRSFNDDKPYDRFIREQIAGDEIDPNDPEMLVAVGFLRMGPWELTGMEVARIARQRFLDDVVNSVGQTFIGHTLRCAKCHDHKFDPVPTRDYYSLMAVFNTTQLTEREAGFLPSENTSGFGETKYLDQRRERFRKIQARLKAKEEAEARKWCEERGLEYIPRAKGARMGIPEEKLPPKKVGFTVDDYGMERISRKGLARLKWEDDRYKPFAFSVYNGATPDRSNVSAPVRMPKDPMKGGELEEGHILSGGDAFSPTQEVEPGTLSALDNTIPELAKLEIPESVSGRRKALADWIAHPRNALTLRSAVNRIWQWHFNQPIAGNPNNFGATGKKPTHPELLDWLAVTFREQGWSFKEMHRLIMTSEAYRRASAHPNPKQLGAKDPNGETCAVFGPRRLTAEELRDSMLAVTGELNPELGGIPNRPEINLEAALQPRMVMGTFAESWQPNPRPAQRHRRSIYALKIRGLSDPFMEVFNQPNPNESCEMRDASTVTPQVFSLFNSQQSYDRAVAWAVRLDRETDSRGEAIRRAFKLAFGRAPSAGEIEACQQHWNEMIRRHRNLNVPKPEYPTEIVRDAVEENTGEKFSFKEELYFYEDFEPDLKLADVDVEIRALAEICLVLFNSNEFAYVY